MGRLLESGTVQAKLRVSQPGDADEIEPDRVAERIVSRGRQTAIQRKCDCSNSSCAESKPPRQESIDRQRASAIWRTSQLSIQRSRRADSSTSIPRSATAETPPTDHAPGRLRALIVEDDVEAVEPGQMRKSQFIGLLRRETCATADAVLATAGQSTKSCPYIEKWLTVYASKESRHLERALRKYAPASGAARTATEIISAVNTRVQRAALTWVRTGEVTGLSEGLQRQLPAAELLEGRGSPLGLAGATLDFLGGRKKEGDDRTGVFRKAQTGENPDPRDAASIHARLGKGRALESGVQARMSAAFGDDFSALRVHSDPRAAALASDLGARAFTIGHDIAFGSHEYRPGTLIGDALIAHELVHVMQQRNAKSAVRSLSAHGADNHALEEEADVSAVHALASTVGAGHRVLGDLRANAIPRLRSGLRLQGCRTPTPKTPAGLSPGAVSPPGDFAGSPFRERTEGQPTAYYTADEDAHAIAAAARDSRVDKEKRATAAVRSIIRTYYAAHESSVSEVVYDSKVKQGLETEAVLDKSKTYNGRIHVGDDFLLKVGGQGSFAHEVLRVGHELEHIRQYRRGLWDVATGGRKQRAEREFLAYYLEGLAEEAPHTGRLQRPHRVQIIDGAIRAFNCLPPDEQSQYASKRERLRTVRLTEMKILTDNPKKFPGISELPIQEPTDCSTAGEDKKDEK